KVIIITMELSLCFKLGLLICKILNIQIKRK
ncbi:hypothetical protein AZ044_000711, partial [Pluralibacter gergoviae]